MFHKHLWASSYMIGMAPGPENIAKPLALRELPCQQDSLCKLTLKICPEELSETLHDQQVTTWQEWLQCWFLEKSHKAPIVTAKQRKSVLCPG